MAEEQAPGRPTRAWRAFRRWPRWAQITTAVVLAIVVIGPFAGDEDEPVEASTEDTTTTTEAETTTTTEPTTTTTEAPDFPDDAAALAEQSAEAEPAVDDALVEIGDVTVSISLAVGAATSEDEARRLLENATRFVATQANAEGPDADSLGGIWDDYDLELIAGPGDGSDRVTAQGYMPTGSDHITWG